MREGFNKQDYLEMLRYIDASSTSYQEWVNVGMALKQEGLSASDWDKWSAGDVRYKAGECYKKWNSFNGEAMGTVTGGTLVYMAQQGGWRPQSTARALAWDEVIYDELVVVDEAWLEDTDVQEPAEWDPKKELVAYLETLFEASDIIGYVTQSWDNGDRKVPSKGVNTRTAGEIIEAIHKYETIGEALGDYDPDVGAWIRFNPLDGKGGKNVNVTDYRYALVESDEMEIGRQYAIMQQLELPVAALVHSGKKSLHAIVRIDAINYEQYKQRVEHLYAICEQNGLKVDQQNKNPSRLSRMPGVMRGENKQWLIATEVGKQSWAEWEEWIEGINDDLPDPEALGGIWGDLPPLAPPLINGILRQGHKMLVAGPSKAGKSFMLIQLAISLAEGRDWLGWACTRGPVLYVNLELDRASALHRFKDVYTAKDIAPEHIDNIDVWNLRGKSVPLDKLAPKLIRRAQKKNYVAVIIDPIYKVITGDENNASDMAMFTNQFDKIATELECAVIYCHHHSKGYQGGKRSMDRASGSGVFARDPDALLDITELELPDRTRKEQVEKARAAAIGKQIYRMNPKYYDRIDSQELYFENVMLNHMQKALSPEQLQLARPAVEQAVKAAEIMTAWRIEGTLREYASFQPRDIWFKYPQHEIDREGVLQDLSPEADKPPWQKGSESNAAPKRKEARKEERINEIEIAFAAMEMEGREVITTEDLEDHMNVSRKTVLRRIKEHGGFHVENHGGEPGPVTRKEKDD